MKANKTNNSMVEIPVATLNCLKQLLFTDKGTNLSSIIEDLTLDDADLTAINVALVYKGIKPQIDENARFKWDYSNKYYTYQFKKFSLINGIISTERTRFAYDEKTDKFLPLNTEIVHISYAEWTEMSTDEASIQTKCLTQ